MDFTDFYAPDYTGARNKFRAAADAAGAALSVYAHPHASGPAGEPLAIDVAHLGDTRAPRQLILISGTHGQEGYAGSAAQVAWLRSAPARQLPAGLGVLLVHGLNPYGFAHGTRTTENNVDLNRNFAAHLFDPAQPVPANPGYAELHASLIPAEWSWDSVADAEAAAQAYGARHGADALFDTRARGQYSHPDGLVFGGHHREWSNLTLETIVREHLAHAGRVGLIDWHTGIGEYGEPFFLCFNADGSGQQARAASWWGEQRVLGVRPHGLARPAYTGLVFHGVERFLGERPLVGAVVEFGTRGSNMGHALRLDQWLRFKAERGTGRYAQLRADMLDAFIPAAQPWRDATVRHGVAITQQAVDGLAAW